MDKEKALIRHEIFNLLTAINMIAASSKLSRKDKSEIQKLVKVTGLLISHEQVILGGKVQLFNEQFDLYDLLDLMYSIHETTFLKCHVALDFGPETMIVKADRTALKDFLEQTLIHLCEFATSVSISAGPDKNLLTIRYSGPGKFELKKMSLLSCLKDKACIKDELPLRLAMHLLEENGIKVTFDKKAIQVRF